MNFWSNKKDLTIEEQAAKITEDLQKDVTKFNEEIEDALQVFRNAVTMIEATNNRIIARKNLARDQIFNLNALINELESAEQRNNDIKAKIQGFLPNM